LAKSGEEYVFFTFLFKVRPYKQKKKIDEVQRFSKVGEKLSKRGIFICDNAKSVVGRVGENRSYSYVFVTFPRFFSAKNKKQSLPCPSLKSRPKVYQKWSTPSYIII